MSRWLRTKKNLKCPVCGRPDWCLIAPDNTAVICMRVSSDRPKRLRTGEEGYIHQMGSEVSRVVLPRSYVSESTEGGRFLNVAAVLRRYSLDTLDHDICAFAEKLGVSAESLRLLGMVWAKKYQAWAFPMRNGVRAPVGIRLRWEDGAKKAVKGSNQGLFIQDEMMGEGPILLPEGPTSTAATISLGFDAIGRPSCKGGNEELVTWYKAEGGKRMLVVVGDHDEPKKRPDGTVFYPGQEGAAKLACDLVKAGIWNVRVIFPRVGKDMRDWLKAGAEPSLVNAIINNTRQWRMRGAA